MNRDTQRQQRAKEEKLTLIGDTLLDLIMVYASEKEARKEAATLLTGLRLQLQTIETIYTSLHKVQALAKTHHIKI